MPRDNSGKATSSQEPAKSGTTILARVYNAVISDIMDMLTDSLSRSGKGKMQADLDLGGKKIINAADLNLKDKGTVATTAELKATEKKLTEETTRLTTLQTGLSNLFKPTVVYNGDTGVTLTNGNYYWLGGKVLSSNPPLGFIKINGLDYAVYFSSGLRIDKFVVNRGANSLNIRDYIYKFSKISTQLLCYYQAGVGFYAITDVAGKFTNFPQTYLRGTTPALANTLFDHIKVGPGLALVVGEEKQIGQASRPRNYGFSRTGQVLHGNSFSRDISIELNTPPFIGYDVDPSKLSHDGLFSVLPAHSILVNASNYPPGMRHSIGTGTVYDGAAKFVFRNPCSDEFKKAALSKNPTDQASWGKDGYLFKPSNNRQDRYALEPATLEVMFSKPMPAWPLKSHPGAPRPEYSSGSIEGGRLFVRSTMVRGFSHTEEGRGAGNEGKAFLTPASKALRPQAGPWIEFAQKKDLPSAMTNAQRDAGISTTPQTVSAQQLRGLDQIKVQAAAPDNTDGRIGSFVLVGANLTLYEKTAATTWTQRGNLIQAIPPAMSNTERDAGTNTAARTVSAALLRGLDQIKVQTNAPAASEGRTGSVTLAGNPLRLYEKLASGNWRDHGALGGVSSRELTATEDLDNVTETGFYTKSTTPAASLNYPTLRPGTLTVAAGSSNITQMYHTLGDDQALYIRGKTTTWSTWQQQRLPLNYRGQYSAATSTVYRQFDSVFDGVSTYYWNNPVAGNTKPSLTNNDWAPVGIGPHLPKKNYVFKDVEAEKAYAAATDIHIEDMDVTITANPGNPILYWLNYNFEAFAGAMFYFKAKIGTAAPVEIWSPTNAGARIAGSGIVPYDSNDQNTLQALSYFNMYTPSITAETEIVFSLHVRFQSAKAMFQNRTISDLNTDTYERATSRVYVEEIQKETIVAHADAKERTDPIIALDSGEPAVTLGALYSMLFVIDGGKVYRKSALGWETLGYLLWGRFNNLLDGQSALYDASTKRWVNSWPVQVARIETDQPSDSLAINTLAINEKSGKGFLRKGDGTWETVFHMTPRAHASISILKYRRAYNADNVFYAEALKWQPVPLNTIDMNSGNDVTWLRNNEFRLMPGKYAISVIASFFSEGRYLDRTKTPDGVSFSENARIKALLRLVLGHKQTMIKGQLCQGWNFGELVLQGELNLTKPHQCFIEALNLRGYSWDTDPTNASRDTSKPVGTSDRVAFGGASGNAAYGDQDDAIVRIQKIGVADPIEDYSLRNKMIVGYSHIQLWSDAEDLGPAVLDKPGETEVYFIQKRPNVNLRVIQFDLATAGDLSNFSDNDKFFERGSADKISTLIWNAARTKMALFTPNNGRFHLYNINRPGELETTQPNPTTKDIALQTGLTYRNAQFSANHSKLFVLASNATSFTIRVYELPTAGDISSITTTSGVTTHTFAESINPSYFTIVNDQEIFMLYGTDANHQNEIIHYRLATAGDFTPTRMSQVGAADAIDGVNLRSIEWIANGRKLIAMDKARHRIIELGHL